MRWLPLVGSLLLGSLAAQTPPVPPEPAPKPAVAAAVEPLPAITLLLQFQGRLNAAQLRRRWARWIGERVGKEIATEGPFVAVEDNQIVGGRDGVRWRLVANSKPHPLPPAAVQYLDEDEARELRTHERQLTVRADTVPPDAAGRRQCDRVLASVAAALLGEGVVGIGAAVHGTFVVFDGDIDDLAEDLLGDDPLRALAPSTSTSLVAFLAAERTLDQAALEQALGKEFGVSFAEPEDGSDSEHFVSVRDGTAFVGIAGQLLLLDLGEARVPAAAELERYQDLRIRRILGDHRQLLRVVTRGSVDAAAEQARRIACARLVAALWGEDVLGLSWHCDRRLVPAGDSVRKQLRSEDPVAATLGDRLEPLLRVTDEKAMQLAIEAARASWGEAVAHHRQGGAVSAKFRFPTRGGNFEHIWVKVHKIDGEQVHGELANEPHDLGDWKIGTVVTAGVGELSDWLFVRDGKRFGAFTVKLLEAPNGAESKPATGGGK